MLDDAEAGADTGLLRVDLAYALCRRGDHAEAASALALAAEEGDLARAGEIAATSRAEFAARGFGRPFTVDRLVAAEG